MRYVHRDENGQIVGHYANPQPYATEAVPDDDAEVAAWEAARAAVVVTDPSVGELQAQLAVLQAQLAALTSGDGGG